MTDKPFAEAAARNEAPILEVLRKEFGGCARVLEIGSGTGQHAVFFASRLTELVWQASDVAEQLAAIQAWIDEAGLPNVRDPLEVDVLHSELPTDAFDAVFSANTAHIMPLPAVERMFALAGRTLRDDGLLCLYGPFRTGGHFSTDSNAAFDAALRARNSAMGIRDLETLDRFAEAAGLASERRYAMPATNELVTWRRH